MTSGTQREVGLGAELKGAATMVHKVVDGLLETPMALLGLSVGESDVITILSLNSDPLTPGDIGDWLDLTSAGVTGRLNSLDRKGMIERRPSEQDGRSIDVHLTAVGSRLADEVIATKDTVIREAVIDVVGEERVRDVVDGIRHILETMASRQPATR